MRRKVAGVILGVTLSVLTSGGLQAWAMPEMTFSDIRPTDWHAGYVMTLSSLDVVRGYSDSTFKPNETISKAEFIVLAVKARHDDIMPASGEHWAMNYMRKAEALGAIASGEAAVMEMNASITREEAARILVRTAGEEGLEQPADPLTVFSDMEAVKETNQPYVHQAVAKGWLSGYPSGEFRPANEVTRAEASVMLTKSLGDGAMSRVEEMKAAAARYMETQEAEAEKLRESILETALELQGIPYRRGGSTPAGFDCSGFVTYVLGQHGISLPRSSAAMYRATEKISMDELEPGDLVFFQGYQSGPSHVGIYVGNNEFIHAPSSGRTVSFDQVDDPSYWGPRQYGAARIL
ncbi:NlpC/P60 family protein [Anoxynatronum sibiricum]|uniref:NlpC/P60 family protein n=1 Tax=Anoxynatronum sibiricum TaxID=210623 RepID=A0ABU9VRS9_9CLOT